MSPIDVDNFIQLQLQSMSIGSMLADRDFLYNKEQLPWGRTEIKTLSLTLGIPYVFKSIKY